MGGQRSSLCVGAGSHTVGMTRPSTASGRRTAGARSAGFVKGNQSQHGCCGVCYVLFFFVCFPFLAFFFPPSVWRDKYPVPVVVRNSGVRSQRLFVLGWSPQPGMCSSAERTAMLPSGNTWSTALRLPTPARTC